MACQPKLCAKKFPKHSIAWVCITEESCQHPWIYRKVIHGGLYQTVLRLYSNVHHMPLFVIVCNFASLKPLLFATLPTLKQFRLNFSIWGDLVWLAYQWKSFASFEDEAMQGFITLTMLENADNFLSALCYQVLEVGSEICEEESHMAGMRFFPFERESIQILVKCPWKFKIPDSSMPGRIFLILQSPLPWIFSSLGLNGTFHGNAVINCVRSCFSYMKWELPFQINEYTFSSPALLSFADPGQIGERSCLNRIQSEQSGILERLGSSLGNLQPGSLDLGCGGFGPEIYGEKQTTSQTGRLGIKLYCRPGIIKIKAHKRTRRRREWKHRERSQT